MAGQDVDRTDDDDAGGDGAPSDEAAALDGSDAPAAVPASARASSGRRPEPAPPLPWYRRGAVWFWFVVASVAAALGIAQLVEDRIYSYEVDPATDVAAAWCRAVEPIDLGIGFWGGLNADEQVHARRVDALRAGAEVAPEEIAADLDEVIGVELERQERAIRLVERRDAGQVASNDDVADLEQEHHVALDRVRGFHRQACPR